MNKELNLLAPVNTLGYGVVGFNILKAMVERGWNIALFPKGNDHGRSESEAMLIFSATTQARFFHYDAPCLNIWHQFNLCDRVGRGKYIAWPIFELDTFDEVEKHNLNYPDELIVCSKWAKDVCEQNGINIPIHVVPLGVDRTIFNTDVVTPSDDCTKFFNAGKWEIRKGHDILCDAFNQAFTPEDNVKLYMMPHNPFLSKQDADNWKNMYLDSPMGQAGKIEILPRQIDHRSVAAIMGQMTCGVFPSRAEGWNLEALEMLALGKQLIITNYSAHTEFCDEYNAMLIEPTNLEPAFDGKWFFEQGNWMEFGDNQMEQLVEYMKLVHDRNQRPGNIINEAGIETAQKFSWDHSCDLLEEILENSASCVKM